jgi:uncharacterized protein (DUF2164 family)
MLHAAASRSMLRALRQRRGSIRMKKIEFSREETKAMVGEIQDYFREELDQTIGDIPAEMLMRFFAERIGPYFYNRGLYDAQAILMQRIDELTDTIYALEQKTDFVR